MKQRVAHVVQKMAPGGLEVLVLQLARWLPGEHYIISLDGDADHLMEQWPRIADQGVMLIGMNKRPGLDPILPIHLASTMRHLDTGAVFTHHAGPLVYGGPAARLAGVKQLFHVEHDIWHYGDAGRSRLMRAIAVLTRPHIVGVAERMRAPLKSIFGTLDVDIIANGVPLDRCYADRGKARILMGLDESQTVIGAVGRLETVKGHDLLIEAAAKIESAPHVVIVGQGSQRADLEALAEKLSITNRVRFLGHRDDVAKLLPGFDVLCQPSRAEGLPLAVLEAQACGVPVVATDVGDLANAVCPSSGRIAPPENVEALALALNTVIDQPSAVSPRAFIAAHFDWNTTLAGYADLLKV